MQLRLIIDTAQITISFDEDNQWLYVDWKGEHTSESSQECCMLMLEALRANPCDKILNDNSSISRTTVQMSLWGAWWLEEMRNAGLRYVAWIYSRNFDARQETEAIIQRILDPIVVSFDDVASAYMWLKQLN
jgi:hypothetical protein